MGSFNIRGGRRNSGKVAGGAKHRHAVARAAIEALEARQLLTGLVVTTTADYSSPIQGQNTLREAIAYAQSLGGNQTITFDPTDFATPQVIGLSGMDLEIDQPGGILTIQGPAAGVTVSGAGMSQVFQVDANVTVSIAGLTITGGFASGDGGGVYNLGTTTLTDCTLMENQAAGNFGGAIFTSGPQLSLDDCTLVSNTARLSGGAIEAQGPVTLISCTLSGNQASPAGQGGGGGAIDDFVGQHPVTIGDSIIAGNMCGFGPDISNAIVSLGNNIIGKTNGNSGWIASDLTGTSANPRDPMLALLGNYGGPTLTEALLPGSPAIDAGSNAVAAGLASDQRGLPRIVNGTVDIGAFESSGFAVAVNAGDGTQSTVAGAPFTNPLGVTVTANNAVEPVAGGVIAYTTPNTGASAVLSNNAVAVIAADGAASVTATANGTAGSYAVTASASGITAPASFSLTNLGVTSVGIIAPTIVYGNNGVVTVTVSSSAGTPTGAVSLTANNSTLTQMLSGGSSTFNLGVLNAGSYALVASYVPQGAFLASSSIGLLQVNKADANIMVTAYHVTFDGNPHTAMATATGVDAGGAALGTSFDLSGTTHTAVGIYNGDMWSFSGGTNYNNTSGMVNDSIGAAVTTTAITSSANPAVYGQPITYTATVTNIGGTGAVPAGTVQFVVDGNNVGAPVVVNATGQAVSPVVTFLTGASHSVTAVFSPNGNFFASGSSLTQTVQSIAIEPDPSNPALTDLFIGSNGATSNDQVQVQPIGSSKTGSTGVQVQTQLNGVNTQTNYNQAFNAIYVYLQNGNDHVQLANTLTTNAVVSAGNGNDQVQLGQGTDIVTLGNGNDQVTAGDGVNTVTVGSGNDNIQLGNGNNVINLGAGLGNDQVQAGNGANTVNGAASNGNDNVHLGTGNNNVTLGNGNDQVQAQPGVGNNTVVLGSGNDNVNLGDGNNSVTVGTPAGSSNDNDNVQVGNGNNVITLVNPTGNDQVHAGAGANTVTGGNSNVNVNLGNGSGNSVRLGDGSDNVQIGNGNNEFVSLGNGNNDTVHLGNGNSDFVRVGDGNDNVQIVAGGNENVIVGNGNDNVQLGDGSSDVVTIGSGDDNVQIGNGNNNTVFLPAAGNPNAKVKFGNGTNNTIQLNGGGGSGHGGGGHGGGGEA